MAAVVTSSDGPAVTQVTIPTKQVRTPGLVVQLLTAGTASCFADLVTFPLDTTKVRLQLQGEACSSGNSAMCVLQRKGVLGTLFDIAKHEGPRALYSGIVPGLQRQMAFSGIRIGSYETVKKEYMELFGATSGLQILWCRIAAGITTGTLAISVAQPADVVKIRMQAHGSAQQYTGVGDAYRTIIRTEGVKNGLYRGMVPNIARNAIINVCETVVYDVAKDGFISNHILKDGIVCHFASAVVAGVTATVVASPVDVIKTRYMNSPRGLYRGVLHCTQQTAVNEGFKAFYKGFYASCSRIVSWNIVLWLTFEQMKKGLNSYYK